MSGLEGIDHALSNAFINGKLAKVEVLLSPSSIVRLHMLCTAESAKMHPGRPFMHVRLPDYRYSNRLQ